MKTILISGLAVNASNQSVKNSQNDLGNMLEHMFADIDTNLKSCYDIIPGKLRIDPLCYIVEKFRKIERRRPDYLATV